MSGETACSTKNSEKIKENELNRIKHVIAIMSGKGGVGKTSITGLMAIGLAHQGYSVGILDGDITGPSIPKIFGIKKKPEYFEFGFLPPESLLGIRIMSLNLLLLREDDPVVWRGPLLAGTVKQFWTDVVWGDLDFLLVDLPPGTGDVPLTVMQSIPLDGIIIVSSPQDLAVMVVKKAIKMAGMLKIPVLGMVENMSYAVCPHCGRELRIFGPSRAEKVASETGVKLLGIIPIDPEFVELCDKGQIERYRNYNLFSDKAFLEALNFSNNKKEGEGQ
jgi:Mrp family chromosome partitioning ATPase